MRTVLLAILISIFSFNAYAQETRAVFTDSMEEEFYQAVKDQGNGHSGAEIEQTTGVGLLNMNNQWQRAQRHFKKAVALDPKLYLAWYDLGIINIDSEQGVGYFRKAIEVNPVFPTPYYWIAYYYTRLGDFKKALPIWEDYLKVVKLEKSKGDGDEDGRIRFAKAVVAQIKSGKPEGELNLLHSNG